MKGEWILCSRVGALVAVAAAALLWMGAQPVGAMAAAPDEILRFPDGSESGSAAGQ